MSTISMSDDFFLAGLNQPSYIKRLVGGMGRYWGVGVLQPNLRIMKGTVPTDFSGLTQWTSRINDILWDSGTNGAAKQLTYWANPVILTLNYGNASASGTATWFWICNYDGDLNQYSMSLFGTVGTIGSGADLEMDTTDIVSGQPYRVENLRIQIPQTWSY